MEKTDHDCIDWNSGGACYICRRPLSIEEQTRRHLPDDDETFTRAEWDAAYRRAALLWHQIDFAKSAGAQKDVMARALLEFRRKDLEQL